MVAFRQVALNLLSARTRRVQVVLGVAADLGLAAGAAVDGVAQRFEARRQLGSVHRRHKLLALVQLARLQRPNVTVLCASEIEDDRVRVELGRRVPVDGSGTVMLEVRHDPLPRCLGRVIAEASLDILFELVKRDANARAMRLTDSCIATDQRRQ